MYIKGEKECRGDKERERERERESGFLMKKERKVELANTNAFEEERRALTVSSPQTLQHNAEKKVRSKK